MSRNKIPNSLLNIFNISEKDMEEYNSCNTDEELAEIIIKDCKSKGLRLLENKNGNNIK